MSGTILLTGATGFVGRQVAARFIADGTPLRVAVRDRDRAPAGASVYSIADLAGPVDWNPALAGVETVIHMAARVHVMHEEARDPLAAYRAVNRDATLALARAACTAGVKRFLYISSIKVNGERTDGRPFTVDDLPHPADPYGISKWEAEEGLRALAKETGLGVVVIRPPLVHGLGAGGNLARLFALVERGLPIPLGAIHNRRTMIGVRNLADLIVVASTHPQAAGRLLLAGDGESVSTPELVALLAAGLGRPARLLSVPIGLLKLGGVLTGRGSEIERLVGSLEVDITGTRAALGWVPPVSLAEGLAEMARAWKEAR